MAGIESKEILAALEFGTATLMIDSAATAKLPSFYMVDICVSALITVGLVEGRRNRAEMMAQRNTVGGGGGGGPKNVHHTPGFPIPSPPMISPSSIPRDLHGRQVHVPGQSRGPIDEEKGSSVSGG